MLMLAIASSSSGHMMLQASGFEMGHSKVRYIYMMSQSWTICPESQIVQTGYLVYFEI